MDVGVGVGVVVVDVEESAMLNDAVDPTCFVRALSEKSLISRVSSPSVFISLLMVWASLNGPLAPTLNDPSRAPLRNRQHRCQYHLRSNRAVFPF